jgi:hypothetical protein
MYGYCYSLYNRLAFVGELDPDATAFFSATGITDATIQGAINTLVVDMKKDGTWSKMKAIYPFVGGTATTHKFNLKDPQDTNGAFRLVFNGGWTHSSNGATPNGTNGYANTNLIATNILTNNSTHLSFYSRTNISATQTEIGAHGTAPNRFDLELSYLGSLASDQYNYTTGRVSVANTNSTGYYISTRTTSLIHKVFKNNLQIGATNTGASGSLALIPLIPIYIGTANNAGAVFSSKQCAFSTIGDGLTDTEALNLYTRVQAFQTTLGRQV